MAMNLSNFKILKEDHDSYEIGHPSGKSITVKKGGLSPRAHEMIKKYADGGEVAPDAPAPDISSPTADDSQMPPQMAAIQAEMDKTPAASNQQMPADMQAIQSEMDRAPAAQTAPTASGAPTGEVGASAAAVQQAGAAQQQAQMDPLLQQKMTTAGLLQNQENQINDYTKASTQLNNNIAGFYKDFAKQTDANNQTHQATQNDLKAKEDVLHQAVIDGKVDPNRFYKNQSTGSRIASAIGIILSGGGAAVAGQQNMAMQQIQKAVDNDIDAQKNEQGKNLNLYQMNREAMRDDMSAQAVTQNQLLTGVQAKISMATAQMQNPATQLRGQQMINELEQQKIQNRMQIGLLSQPGAQSPQGNLSAADPAVLIPMFIKDPTQQKAAFDEVKKAQDANKSYNEMQQSFNDAAKQNTILRTGAGYVRTPEAINKLHNLGLPLIKDQDGRVNEFENKAYQSLLPAPGDTEAKIAQKRQDMVDFWKAKMAAPTVKGASGGAIDLTKFQSTSLPQPSQTATMNGMQYEKVPGGWKKVSQ